MRIRARYILLFELYANSLNIYVVCYLARMYRFSAKVHFRTKSEILSELNKEKVDTTGLDEVLQKLEKYEWIKPHAMDTGEDGEKKYEATLQGRKIAKLMMEDW